MTKENIYKKTIDKLRWKGNSISELQDYFKKDYCDFYNRLFPQEFWEVTELSYSSPAEIEIEETGEKIKSSLNTLVITRTQAGKTSTYNRFKEKYCGNNKAKCYTNWGEGCCEGIPLKRKSNSDIPFKTYKHPKTALREREKRIMNEIKTNNKILFFCDSINMGNIINSLKDEKIFFRSVTMLNEEEIINGNPHDQYFSGNSDVYDIIIYYDGDTFWKNKETSSKWCEKAIEKTQITKSDWITKKEWIESRSSNKVKLTKEMESYIKEKVDIHLSPKYKVENGKSFEKNNVSPILFDDFFWNRKIQKISMAIAASTLSTDENCENIILKKVHIDYAIELTLKNSDDPFSFLTKLEQKKNKISYTNEELKILRGERYYSNEIKKHMFNLYEYLFENTKDKKKNIISIPDIKEIKKHLNLILKSYLEGKLEVSTSEESNLFKNIIHDDMMHKTMTIKMRDKRNGDIIFDNWINFMEESLRLIEMNASDYYKYNLIIPKFYEMWEIIRKEI